MRFYTKEMQKVMRNMADEEFSMIPDGDYTDAGIAALYQKALEEEIASEEKRYNTEPVPVPVDEEKLREEGFDPEEYLIVEDLETCKVRHPKSVEEVRENRENLFRQCMEEYKNRPPFQKQWVIESFERMYQERLSSYVLRCPAWMWAQVDHRLLALNLLPESAYRRFREEFQRMQDELDRVEREEAEVRAQQNIPDEVEQVKNLWNACLISLKEEGGDYSIIVRQMIPGPQEEDGFYTRLVFHDARVLEREDNLRMQPLQEGGFYYSDIFYTDSEIYNAGTGYEVHMLFSTPDDYAYLTIACSGVTSEDFTTAPLL